jgi:hypothetical protein
MPALPEAARLLSAAHGVPTLRTPDLRNKRQTAQILTSHQDLTITSPLRHGHILRSVRASRVSRPACRLLDTSRQGIGMRRKRCASWRKRSRASVASSAPHLRQPVPGSHGLAVAAGVGAQYESEVVYHNLQKDLADQGVIFLDMDSGLREHEDMVRRYFRHDHPVQRQQVRRAQLGRVVGWLVHLRAAGRQGRAAAAGVLPHQRREHGPVRAHVDPGGRGRLRALRRGLHRADLLHRLAALGRGGDPRRPRAAVAAIPRFRTGRPTSTTWSPSAPSRRRPPRWSGSTGTSARRSR